ncbi:MAG TPA: tetratricopeptide repeat protein [Chthoniobacter sp.]|nr:tetratricopeptide repeat protein [Chthoniobacter sp.]
MNGNWQIVIDRVHALVDAEKYSDAFALIEEQRDRADAPSLLHFYEGICLYEQGDDNGCLRLLAKFIDQEPAHIKSDYAVFTAAICLVNLGMDDLSNQLLDRLPASYPDLAHERKCIDEVLRRKREAIPHCDVILNAISRNRH